MDEEIFEFAMVISVAPDCAGAWDRALRMAKPPAGMSMTIRNSALVFFTVSAIQEYVGIEKAEAFLEGVGKTAGVRCALNVQPSHEV